MDQGLIPRRYAKALLKFAAESKSEELVYRLMKRLVTSMDAEPAMQQTMANPYVSDDDKAALLTVAAGAADADSVFTDFVKLLARNRRMADARLIAKAYVDLYRLTNGIHRVTLTSAAPMTAAATERIKAIVTGHLGAGSSMEFSSAVNPDLIGGFTVGIDNEVLDASVSNELKQLRLKLLSK